MLGIRCKYYKNEAIFHGFTLHIMGIRFDILLIHSDIDRLNILWADIIYELERLDEILDRFDPHSEASKINSHTSQSKIQISKEMESILQFYLYHYETTSHLFDITLKDFFRIQLHEYSCIPSISSDISLDSGGFAKGYALGKIRRFTEQENISDAFTNFGDSSILGIGRHPYGDCWEVNFLNPYNQSLLKEFDLQDIVLSTSGNTLQYTGHTMNPPIGIFNEQRKASPILSPDLLEAEAPSTVWMVVNEQEQEKISKKFNNTRATLYDL